MGADGKTKDALLVYAGRKRGWLLDISTRPRAPFIVTPCVESDYKQVRKPGVREPRSQTVDGENTKAFTLTQTPAQAYTQDTALEQYNSISSLSKLKTPEITKLNSASSI